MVLTPQEIIKDSLTNFKEEQAKARREEVRKFLDYYSGSLTDQYIEVYFKYCKKIRKSYVKNLYYWC